MLALLALLVGPSFADLPAPTEPVDADAPAADPPVEESIWDYIESAEGGPPAPAVIEASKELAQERLAELEFLGAVGAEPAVEYYTDPFAATEADPLHIDKINPKEFDIPIAVNDMVKGWMNYFLGRGRGYYTRYLQRSTKWIPMMHREIARRGLPRDLIYLSMIESGFTTSATSYASAAGLWQFMPATGRQYGLRVDYWLDERRDPEKATRSALEYLAYLAKMFDGDWWLAWASYNGGEGRVQRATQRYGTTDFWTLVKKDALHPETENYVPKLIAAAIIGKHPDRYGFTNLKYEPEWSFDTVSVPAGTALDVLARCAGVTEEELVEFNPALRRWALAPDPETQSLRVPKGRKEQFETEFAKVPPEERNTYVRHVVRRGESVSSIASKYGTTADAIMQVNHLRSSKSKLSVGMELVIPGGKAAQAAVLAEAAAEDAAATAAKSSAPAATTEKKLVVKSHKVKSGETLSGIASKYGLTLTELKKLNGISRNTAYAGETLVVKKYYTTETTTDASKSTATASTSKSSTSTASSSKSTTTSSSSKSKTTTYTVRKGDSLGSIASKYGVSVSELKAWNGLKGSTIYPGQKLKIKG